MERPKRCENPSPAQSAAKKLKKQYTVTAPGKASRLGSVHDLISCFFSSTIRRIVRAIVIPPASASASASACLTLKFHVKVSIYAFHSATI